LLKACFTSPERDYKAGNQFIIGVEFIIYRNQLLLPASIEKEKYLATDYSNIFAK
jgi:hypothetical protein